MQGSIPIVEINENWIVSGMYGGSNLSSSAAAIIIVQHQGFVEKQSLNSGSWLATRWSGGSVIPGPVVVVGSSN